MLTTTGGVSTIGLENVSNEKMRLRAAQGKLKIEHSIIDGLRPVLERLLHSNPEIRSIIPGVIRPVRDAKGAPSIRITVATTNAGKQ